MIKQWFYELSILGSNPFELLSKIELIYVMLWSEAQGNYSSILSTQ